MTPTQEGDRFPHGPYRPLTSHYAYLHESIIDMASVNQLEMYIGMGIALFPCSQHNKKPLTPHGFKDASLDRATITIWLAKYPDCAWGTPTSADHGVVDIDPRHGGVKAWEALIARHGDLPPHPITETGSKGSHHWLTFPPATKCSQSLIGPGIDVKAEGGYVIVPPSRIHEPHHV